MEQAILLGAASASGTVVTIDGIAYNVALVNAAGSLFVAQAAAATTITTGRGTVAAAGTRVQLAANAAKAVRLRALTTNVGNIYFGNVGVTSANGDILAPGEVVPLSIDNLNRIYIDADTAANAVSWTVLN